MDNEKFIQAIFDAIDEINGLLQKTWSSMKRYRKFVVDFEE